MPRSNSSEVHISGQVKVGGHIVDGDSITHNGVPVGEDKRIDLSNAPDELRIGMKLGNSITKGKVTYIFVKQDGQTGEYIYRKSTEKTSAEKQDSTTTETSEPEVSSEKWLQQLNAKIEKATTSKQTKEKVGLPSFDSIKDSLPKGATTSRDFVGGKLQIGSRSFRMHQPVTQTQEGYVYVPIT